jgi:restriction system protein
MAIPDYQNLMLPLLRLASDRKEHQLRAVTETLTDEFTLSSEERMSSSPAEASSSSLIASAGPEHI